MSHAYLQKVRAAFQRNGYNPNSFIRKSQYHQLLNSMMRSGQQYDQQVANQLWFQAADNRQNVTQLRIDDICSTIVEGQTILQQQNNKEQIVTLEKQKKQLLNSGQGRHSSNIQKLINQIQGLEQDKAQFTQDLRLVTQPFNINSATANIVSRYSPSKNYDHYGGNQLQQSNIHSSQQQQHKQLKWVLILTLIFCFFEIIIIYGKYQFLNLIVVTCLLSIYLLNFFDQVYIKFTLGLLLTSIVLDIVWLFLYADQKWNPPKVGNNSIYEAGYMKFIVVFTFFIIFLKIPLGWFLFKYKDASPDNKYVLSMGLMKIVLSANKSNPITRGLNNSLPI